MAWQVLDAADLRRHRRRLEGERRIEWRVSLRTRMKFRTLLSELIDLETWPASLEVETRKQLLQAEIRDLPGFPRRYDPERDLIVPVTTTEMR